MRIGVHTVSYWVYFLSRTKGDYLGGVLGTTVVRYDLFGPDVLIANKMESNGCIDRVMVS